MKTIPCSLLACCATPLIMFQANATIHDVWPDSSGTVQEIVMQASDGDTVLLHPGEHYGTTVLCGRELTIGSLFLLDGDTSHVAETVVHADSLRTDTASCFVYAYDESPDGRLVGLMLTGGRGTFHLISEFMVGGAVHVSRGGVQIERCEVRNCRADAGGGIGVQARHGSHNPTVRIRNCTIEDCVADVASGGVFGRRCNLDIHDTHFIRDIGHVEGAIEITASQYSITNCSFVDCVSGIFEAVYITGGAGTVSGCFFEGNVSLEGDVAHFLAQESEILVCGNHFSSNPGSNLALEFMGEGPPMRFIGNLVEHTEAIEGRISASILVSSGADLEFAYNIIRDNTTLYGSHIQVIDHSEVRFHHSVFLENTAINPVNSTLVIATNHGHPTLDSNVISGHNGGVIGSDPFDSIVIDARHNWWGHITGPYHPTRNPFGEGDTLLSDSVLFDPWLLEPPDTTMPSGVDERPEITNTWEIMGLYPNPFNSEFRLVLAGFAGPEFQITLHDILGREAAVIHRGVMTGGSLSYTAPPRLASGVYFVRASDSHHINTRKVILLK